MAKKNPFIQQCVGCLQWFGFDEMYYYLTDEEWMCASCASIYNNW